MTLTYKISSYASVFVAGAVTSLLLSKPHQVNVPETKVVTQTKTIVKQEPAKIVYKDKIREITLDCPTNTVSQDSHTEVRVNPPLNNIPIKLRLSLLVNPMSIKNVNQYKINFGYFVSNNLSIDAQSSIKFDTIETGISFYF